MKETDVDLMSPPPVNLIRIGSLHQIAIWYHRIANELHISETQSSSYSHQVFGTFQVLNNLRTSFIHFH